MNIMNISTFRQKTILQSLERKAHLLRQTEYFKLLEGEEIEQLDFTAKEVEIMWEIIEDPDSPEDLTLEEFNQLNKGKKATVYLNALRSLCSAMNIY